MRDVVRVHVMYRCHDIAEDVLGVLLSHARRRRRLLTVLANGTRRIEGVSVAEKVTALCVLHHDVDSSLSCKKVHQLDLRA